MVQKEKSEPKKRGRPRAYDPATAVARAAETFWKAGYAGTSLDDLSEATGMNRPSLYAAFGDKRDLYLKTLEYYRNESRALARAALADHPPLRVFLKRFYDKALELYLEGGPRGCYSIGTAATVAAVDDGVRAFLAESMRTTDSFLKHQIEKARERGEIAHDADAEALAYLASATLHTLAVRSRAGLPRKELDALVDAAIGVICGKP
ncbi:MAG: TetR/AcrR family transcriptional regulator [Candidatus Binataceae bacterium]